MCIFKNHLKSSAQTGIGNGRTADDGLAKGHSHLGQGQIGIVSK